MAQYVDRNRVRETVPVGVTTTVIVPVTNLRGSEENVVELINDGVEDITCTIEVSFTGDAPFMVLQDSTFEAMGAGVARTARIPAQWQFFRITGAFTTTPGNMRCSVAAQKSMAHK